MRFTEQARATPVCEKQNFRGLLHFSGNHTHARCMHPDLVQIRALAGAKEDENWEFRMFTKTRCSLDPEEMDRQVREVTKRVWAGIDCTTCANCCREVRPTFSEEDVARLSRRLGVTLEEFVLRYLERTGPDEENPWRTRSKPCPFLDSNRCGVYEDRPADCRGYPYLYEPKFVSRTMGMIERTHTCPIVYEVFEELKRLWGFRRKRGSRN